MRPDKVFSKITVYAVPGYSNVDLLRGMPSHPFWDNLYAAENDPAALYFNDQPLLFIEHQPPAALGFVDGLIANLKGALSRLESPKAKPAEKDPTAILSVKAELKSDTNKHKAVCLLADLAHAFDVNVTGTQNGDAFKIDVNSTDTASLEDSRAPANGRPALVQAAIGARPFVHK